MCEWLEFEFSEKFFYWKKIKIEGTKMRYTRKERSKNTKSNAEKET